jgi:hypothetical protein
MPHLRCSPGAIALGALTLVLLAAPLPAQTTYFGEDLHNSAHTRATPTNANSAASLFLATLSGVGTETFETRSGGAPLALDFPGAGTATLNGSGGVKEVISGTNGYGRYPISGNRYWEVDAGSFTIAFSNPVGAFGFYGVDIGDFNSQLLVNLLLEAGGETQLVVPHTVGSSGSSDGSIFFWGYTDATSPFTGVRFEIQGTADVFAFDDMTIGAPGQIVPPTSTVPEPGTVILLATGLAALGGMGIVRRRGTLTVG